MDKLRLTVVGLVAVVTLGGCCTLPRSTPGGRHHGTTTSSTTTAVPGPSCEALGCPGSPPDPDLGCLDGQVPVDGLCP